MPKSITIHPTDIRQKSVIKSREILINAYTADPSQETQKYGTENLVRMYRDMLYIREFETMLGQIKKKGSYAGIEYDHCGPAHLSIGQEAAVVGQCYHLLPEDFIYGSHRSHGEILAKSFSAIEVLDQNELMGIMESYLDGMLLR
ncbi:MAG: thiamine pyrophosphate-dependent enzyme, partial [Candidatus Poribacteria bacterium]|nr:thiamine pyrophosphate-dependent enzyme [Candidatus Poribacteria bacterium]